MIQSHSFFAHSPIYFFNTGLEPYYTVEHTFNNIPRFLNLAVVDDDAALNLS